MTSKSSSPTKKPSSPEKSGNAASAKGNVPLAQQPTTEDLLSIEDEIKRLIEKKRVTDLHLIDLEARIFASEELYNKETKQFGAIINGLEGYMGISASLSNNISTDSLDSTKGRGGGEEGEEGESSFKFLDKHPFSSTSASHQRALAVHSKLVRDRVLKPILIPGFDQRKGDEGDFSSGGNGIGSGRSSKKDKQRDKQKKRKRVR